MPADIFKKLFDGGDKDAVATWFDNTAPRDINETFTRTEPYLMKRVGAEPTTGHTTLALVAHSTKLSDGHVALVRWLVARGANPNIRNEDGWSPLDFACASYQSMATRFTANMHEIILLLIAAGADVNAFTPSSRDYPDNTRYTPLGQTLNEFQGRNDTDTRLGGLEFVVRALLRAGASLDNCSTEPPPYFHKSTMAEYLIEKAMFETRQLAVWQKVQILVREVGAAGSYKACFVRPRKQILTLRTLARSPHRGDLSVIDGEDDDVPAVKARAATSDAVLNFVFGLPNGPAWNVFSFWRCSYRIRVPNSSGGGGPDDFHWRTGPW